MMANGGAPMMQPGMNSMMASEMGNMNMGPQMMDPMMAGMGGEMGMDGVGVGVGVGVGAPQQGQGGPMPDQMGVGVEGFGPQGGMGMGMSEYGMQVCRSLRGRATRRVQRGEIRTRAGCNRCSSSSSSSNSNSFSNSKFSRSSSSNNSNNICFKIWRFPSHRRRPWDPLAAFRRGLSVAHVG